MVTSQLWELGLGNAMSGSLAERFPGESLLVLVNVTLANGQRKRLAIMVTPPLNPKQQGRASAGQAAMVLQELRRNLILGFHAFDEVEEVSPDVIHGLVDKLNPSNACKAVVWVLDHANLDHDMPAAFGRATSFRTEEGVMAFGQRVRLQHCGGRSAAAAADPNHVFHDQVYFIRKSAQSIAAHIS